MAYGPARVVVYGEILVLVVRLVKPIGEGIPDTFCVPKKLNIMVRIRRTKTQKDYLEHPHRLRFITLITALTMVFFRYRLSRFLGRIEALMRTSVEHILQGRYFACFEL